MLLNKTNSASCHAVQRWSVQFLETPPMIARDDLVVGLGERTNDFREMPRDLSRQEMTSEDDEVRRLYDLGYADNNNG